jgi:segregation and condensation protein B
MEFLKQHVEALIFASPQPVSAHDMKAVMEEAFQAEVKESDILQAIQDLKAHFQQELYAFELVEIAGGWQFLTKGAYHTTVAIHLRQATKKRLSQAALETLALIAYKQPVSRPEIEEIRGVNCDYAIQKLLEKELVFIAGRSEGPGRPLLYGTTEKFMDYLGINSLTDLPKPKDFKDDENSVGEVPSAEEFVSQAMPSAAES